MALIPNTPVRFILWASATKRYWAIGAVCAVISGVMCTRLLFYFIKLITDAATTLVNQSTAASPEQLALLWTATLGYVAVYFLTQVTWRISGFCGMHWITGVLAFIKESLFGYLLGHSRQYFSDRFAGALTNKIHNACRGAETLIHRSLWEFLPLLSSSVFNIVLMQSVHSYMTWAFTLWFIILVVVSTTLALYLKPIFYDHASAASVLSGKIVDSASNIESVQYAGNWQYEKRYVHDFIEGERKTHLRAWWHGEWVLVVNNILVTLSSLTMMWLAVWLIQYQKITVGDLVMVITVIFTFNRELFFVGQRITESMADYGKIQEGLDELLKAHEIKDSATARSLAVTAGAIEIKDLSFAYKDNPVFSNFHLNIPAGQKVGLVGYSGVGKSTLVNLILRQFELQSGAIAIDGTNITDVTLESLRRAIAVVPQSVSLFHRTILDNLRYDKLEATESEVIAAAKLAAVDPFVQRLPGGYQALVGERGVKLSGGERQRIAIARAILKNAPIIILDEATSSLDSESELAIQGALRELIKGRTVIAIAHRLSTLQIMDRLIVLDHGRIVEDGTHHELLKLGGIYSKLWNNQINGFIEV